MTAFIIVFLLLNIILGAILRYGYRGKFDIVPDSNNTGLRPRIYLAAGLLNQPINAYQYIDFSDYDVFYLQFSPIGYNPRYAGRALADNPELSHRDILFGISVGAKALEYAELPNQQILINPCSHPIVLKPLFYDSICIAAPLLEIISYGLGLASILPIIPIGLCTTTSLALLADQLFWIGYGDAPYSNNSCGIIISKQDEFLDNFDLRLSYSLQTKANFAVIDTRHGTIGDNTGPAALYQEAINQLLKG